MTTLLSGWSCAPDFCLPDAIIAVQPVHSSGVSPWFLKDFSFICQVLDLAPFRHSLFPYRRVHLIYILHLEQEFAHFEPILCLVMIHTSLRDASLESTGLPFLVGWYLCLILDHKQSGLVRVRLDLFSLIHVRLDLFSLWLLAPQRS